MLERWNLGALAPSTSITRECPVAVEKRALADRPPEPAARADPAGLSRIERHREIEAQIQELDDAGLLRLVRGTEVLERGHATICLPSQDTKVFVKLLPLSALELQPRHRRSTANLFRLPAHYQYRIGSCGFGTWRELAAHELANQWVLSGACPHFPLLHGWRVLPLVPRGDDDRRSMIPWGNDPAIRRRLSSLEEATSSVAVFLEHFPQTLSQWLADRLAHDLDPMAVVAETEANLLELLTFCGDRGLLHMDAHFENLLTDGEGFFLGDFGLAISQTFSLDAEEREFFEKHRDFDRCTAITSLVHAAVSHYDAREDWRGVLRELQDDRQGPIQEIPVAIRAYLAKRGPLALEVGEFYRRLLSDLSATEFPTTRLQRVLDES